MMSSIQNRVGRNFVIFHPSDFSKASELAFGHALKIFETIVRRGEVVDEILKLEANWRPDLMVLATQGHIDFLDALRGSTTERVLRGAHCPVLAVPAP